MNRKIFLYWGNDEEYEVASDATITEEYSETLDSASVVLPSVKSSRGIVYGAKPYDEVYLSVVSSADGTEEYGAWMLIDSIDATQVSYTGEDKYFDVTLQLMSETKYLEKMQLPNVSMTHSLVDGTKTLYEAIEYYLGIYSPSGAFDGGAGRTNVISMDESSDWTKFKATPCADVMMSKPTLRQCLTTLMAQIGCIPVVKHRKLTYLDLGAANAEFAFGGKQPEEVGSERRSMSSDSWVNAIISECSQSIDKNSVSVVESLCFRDRENVLLKQESNLKLETRYPIYSVNKLVLNAYVKTRMNLNQTYLDGGGGIMSSLGPGVSKVTGGATGAAGPGAYALNMVFGRNDDGVLKLKVTPCASALFRLYAYCVLSIHQVLATVNDDGSLTVKKTMDNPIAGTSVVFAGVKQSESWKPEYLDTFDESDYTGKEITLVSYSLYSGYIGYGTSSDQKWTPSESNPNMAFVTDSYDGADDHNQYKNYFSVHSWKDSIEWGGDIVPVTYYRNDATERAFYSSADISPLCVEATKRAQLDVDYLKMPTWGDINTMAKYFYATVGYSIGGTSIEGFSAKYEINEGFWNKDYTYIENIVNSVGAFKAGANQFYAGAFYQSWWNYLFYDAKIANPFFASNNNNFSLLFFDVEYIPLIQSKIAYEKDDVNMRLEQLDNAESGVSSLDAVSRLEEQKADRLGNPVHSFHARVESYSDLPALNSAWGDRIAFKRVLKFGANAIDAEYVLSKDYVIKNYFTSIVTKYRAYEYVDYSQSIERKESMRAYIRLGTKNDAYVNKDNKWPSDRFPSALATSRTLIDSLEGYQGSATKLTCAGFVDASATADEDKYITEGELSVAVTGNKCVLTMKEYDNESDGPYVDGTWLTINGDYSDSAIGGIPQKWYPSNDGKVRSVCFHSVVKPLRKEVYSTDADAYIQENARAMQKYPRYYYQDISSALDFNSFWLVNLPFAEKDASELLSLSLQFEACWAEASASSRLFNDKSKVKFGKWLYRFSSALGGYPSESAYLAMKDIDGDGAWTDAQRKKSDGETWTEINYFMRYKRAPLRNGYIYFTVNSKAKVQNVKSAIELAVIDGDCVYPIAKIARGVLGAATYIYLRCVPSKTDGTLSESAGHSLLYES